MEKTVGGETTRYVYDGSDIVADGSERYYLADALGSIMALTDESGTVTARYNYSPFGQTGIMLDTDGSGAANTFRYTGREQDETGVYCYRARYYSPEMGRFISEDPIGFAGGINFYAYVRNIPVNWVDPLGLQWHSRDEWSDAFTGMSYDDLMADAAVRCEYRPTPEQICFRGCLTDELLSPTKEEAYEGMFFHACPRSSVRRQLVK